MQTSRGLQLVGELPRADRSEVWICSVRRVGREGVGVGVAVAGLRAGWPRALLRQRRGSGILRIPLLGARRASPEDYAF